MKKMTLAQVLELMEQETNYYGFRGASKRDIELARTGEYLDASLDLWDSRECDYDEDADRLNGTSAICITEYMDIDGLKERYEDAKGYATNHHGTDTVFFVSGDTSDYDGADEREIILKSDFENGARIIAEVTIA